MARENANAELLSAYLDGELTAEEQDRVERWLVDDPAARQLLDEFRALSGTLQGLPSHALGEDLSVGVLQRAEREILLGRAGADGEAPSKYRAEGRKTSTSGTGAGLSAAEGGWRRRLARMFGARALGWSVAAVAVALLLMLSVEPDRDGDRDLARQDREEEEAEGLDGSGEITPGEHASGERAAGGRADGGFASGGIAAGEAGPPRPALEHRPTPEMSAVPGEDSIAAGDLPAMKAAPDDIAFDDFRSDTPSTEPARAPAADPGGAPSSGSGRWGQDGAETHRRGFAGKAGTEMPDAEMPETERARSETSALRGSNARQPRFAKGGRTTEKHGGGGGGAGLRMSKMGKVAAPKGEGISPEQVAQGESQVAQHDAGRRHGAAEQRQQKPVGQDTDLRRPADHDALAVDEPLANAPNQPPAGTLAQTQDDRLATEELATEEAEGDLFEDADHSQRESGVVAGAAQPPQPDQPPQQAQSREPDRQPARPRQPATRPDRNAPIDRLATTLGQSGRRSQQAQQGQADDGWTAESLRRELEEASKAKERQLAETREGGAQPPAAQPVPSPQKQRGGEIAGEGPPLIVQVDISREAARGNLVRRILANEQLLAFKDGESRDGRASDWKFADRAGRDAADLGAANLDIAGAKADDSETGQQAAVEGPAPAADPSPARRQSLAKAPSSDVRDARDDERIVQQKKLTADGYMLSADELGGDSIEIISLRATPAQIERTLGQLAGLSDQVVSLSVDPAPGQAHQNALLRFNRKKGHSTAQAKNEWSEDKLADGGFDETTGRERRRESNRPPGSTSEVAARDESAAKSSAEALAENEPAAEAFAENGFSQTDRPSPGGVLADSAPAESAPADAPTPAAPAETARTETAPTQALPTPAEPQAPGYGAPGTGPSGNETYAREAARAAPVLLIVRVVPTAAPATAGSEQPGGGLRGNDAPAASIEADVEFGGGRSEGDGGAEAARQAAPAAEQ